MDRLLKLLFLLTFILGSLYAHAQTTNYQIYSLFVLNIARYSTWPGSANEFRIAIYGKSKVYDELMKQSINKSINGLPLKISQSDNLAELGTPNIIFLAEGKSAALNEILKAIEGKPVMLITEREGLFRKGGGFSFVIMDNNTLRFDINNTDLEKRQIKVSKNLINLANSAI
jgi:hypothetical protein